MSTTIVPLGSSAIFVDGGKLRYINAKTGIGLICSNVSGTPLEVKPDRLVYVDDSKVEVVTKPLFLLEAFVAGERAKRGALLETRILAMNPAKWLQTATSTTTLTPQIILALFIRFARSSLKMRFASLGAGETRSFSGRTRATSAPQTESGWRSGTKK